TTTHSRRSAGGWLAMACTNARMFGRLLDAMDRADLRDDPRLGTTRQRLAHRQLVDDLVATWVGERTAEDVLTPLAAAEVPSSLVMSVRDLFEDAHVRARGN